MLFRQFIPLAALSFAACVLPARADVILDFQSVVTAQGSDNPFFTPVSLSGFTLTDTNPSTGFSAGFEAHGSASPFYAGEAGLLAFAPSSSPPDNLIALTRPDATPFNLVSIDLARNFAFDPAPTVTFTGTKVGGGTVTQTFTVTTPVGVAAFQTFDFTGFTNLVSVTWGQPQLADGLHQFANIDLQLAPASVPEPATWPAVAGLSLLLAFSLRRRRVR